MTSLADENARLRRIARRAANTYVGTHWPSMDTLRRSGLGVELTEDREHDPYIRRFLSEFSPEFVGDLLDALAAAQATLDTVAAERDALRAALVRAISTLENYGYHHKWCAWYEPWPDHNDCTCGLSKVVAVLEEDRKAALAAASPAEKEPPLSGAEGRPTLVGIDLANGRDQTVTWRPSGGHGHYKADGFDMCAVCDDDWPCAFVRGWSAALATASPAEKKT